MGNSEEYQRQQVLQLFAQGWAGPIISPNLFREIDSMLDADYYKPGKHQMFAAMWSQVVVIPGLVTPRKWGMKPMLNALGEPVQIERHPGERIVKFKTEDPVWQALATKTLDGVFLPVATRIPEIVTADGEIRDMTPDEHYLYQQEVGKRMRIELEKKLEWFNNTTPEKAKRFIDRHSSRIKKRVKREIARK
jgi:hypothetical protein